MSESVSDEGFTPDNDPFTYEEGLLSLSLFITSETLKTTALAEDLSAEITRIMRWFSDTSYATKADGSPLAIRYKELRLVHSIPLPRTLEASLEQFAQRLHKTHIELLYDYEPTLEDTRITYDNYRNRTRYHEAWHTACGVLRNRVQNTFYGIILAAIAYALFYAYRQFAG